MPVDMKLYPTNWATAIRPAILARAGNRCEECGVANYAVGHRETSGAFVLYREASSHPEAVRIRQEAYTRYDAIQPRAFVVVLTVSHTDHDVTNNFPDNLRALCQRCHLLHDQDQHRHNSARTRRRKMPQRDMFEEAS